MLAHIEGAASGPAGRRQAQVGAGALVQHVFAHAGEGGPEQLPVLIEQHHVGHGFAPHLGQRPGQGGLQQDATHHLVVAEDRSGGRQGRGRAARVPHPLVAQGVVVPMQHLGDQRLCGQVGAALEGEATRVGRVRLLDLEQRAALDIEDLHASQPVVDLDWHDQLFQGGLISPEDRRVDPLRVGDQPDSGHLAGLKVGRAIQGRVLRLDRLAGDPLLQRTGHQAGGEIGPHDSQDHHQ